LQARRVCAGKQPIVTHNNMMKPFAFVFPGQGSQSVGMLDAWGADPVVAQALQEASDALHEDVGALIRQGPKEALALTTNTQPVMLVAGVAAYRVWMARVGLAPQAVAGHSLGEYSALVAAGVLSLAQAAPLVRLRAQAMQEAVPVGTGAMAAVLGLDAAKVIALCAEVTGSFGDASSELVQAANFNEPAQTVIAGSKAAVERACEVLKANGARRALALPVSAPFHSSLMRPAAEKLRAALLAVDACSAGDPPGQQCRRGGRPAGRPATSVMRCIARRLGAGALGGSASRRSSPAALLHVVECGPGKVLALAWSSA
jgi:[acyl-carrier-protein] S-malonyltransferase